MAIFLVLLCLASRICVAYYLANDAPGDGVVYARIAKNLLEQGVYSTDTEAPFSPTLIRLPGYPLFVAAVYSVFGHENNAAVRMTQAVFDTGTCIIIALLAGLWMNDAERKRRAAMFAFICATLCPFIVIYTATILTETPNTFLMAAMTLTATLAFKAASGKRSAAWWAVTGLLSGAAVLLRPDSGLFAAAIGLTLVISGFFFRTADSSSFIKRFLQVAFKGSIFSIFFLAVLAPWTIRNYRVFSVFQPIAPSHAEMPGEFVSFGYFRWLRTWIDDSRFIEPMLWNLGEKPIKIESIPARDFDSPEERERVAALLQQYNHPPGSEDQNEPASTEGDENSSDEADSGDQSMDNSSDESDTPDANNDDSADQQAEDSPEEDDENKKYFVKMTPAIDAQFDQIAAERIDRSPLRYYIFIPAKRATAMWFDSHSLYYPFGGQMSPIADLDYDVNQRYWLPAFTLLMWLYTLLAVGGIIVLWRGRANWENLRWIILLSLMAGIRIVFLSSMENPEQRYVIELFAFTAILGGIFLGNLKRKAPIEETSPEREMLASRILSLDAFRGFTIAAMTLVDWPGTWTAVYPQLAHAEWNGATFADWIFPFFLFIVGVSIAFALSKKSGQRVRGPEVYFKIFRRSATLFAVGLLLQIFPFYNIWTATWFEPASTRIMGVLQRIAVCYLAAALVFLRANWKRQLIIAGVLLLVYWVLMTLIGVPGCDMVSVSDKVCNLSAYIDREILTERHIWNQSRVFDPEGLLSTIPAIVTTLIGVLAGTWLRSDKGNVQKTMGLASTGILLLVFGLLWSIWLPLNKSLWTSSYTLYTGGLALVFMAVFYWVIDVKSYTKWAKPFLIFGANAVALFVGSTILGSVLNTVELSEPHGKSLFLQEKIFNVIFLPMAEPVNASLLFALSTLLGWLFLMWLLYRKRIFIKI